MKKTVSANSANLSILTIYESGSKFDLRSFSSSSPETAAGCSEGIRRNILVEVFHRVERIYR